MTGSLSFAASGPLTSALLSVTSIACIHYQRKTQLERKGRRRENAAARNRERDKGETK